MRKQLGTPVMFDSQFKTLKERIASDDTVTVVATGAIILIGWGVSGASVLEDDAVAVVATSAIVLVGGNGGRKNNAVEGIHVESVVVCCDAN